MGLSDVFAWSRREAKNIQPAFLLLARNEAYSVQRVGSYCLRYGRGPRAIVTYTFEGGNLAESSIACAVLSPSTLICETLQSLRHPVS